MAYRLHYGIDSTLELEFAADAVLADSSLPRIEPLDDPAAAIATALAEPLEFPPIMQAIVPGDRIVLSLSHASPQVSAVAAGVVLTLFEHEVPPEDVTIVHSAGGGAMCDGIRLLLPEFAASRIQWECHDPNDANSLAYLAASKDGNPIYLNRSIHEADVVIPIGLLHLGGAADVSSGGLFPEFSDRRTQERFTAMGGRGPDQRRRLQEEADEAAWLLGVQFSVQIIPGAGNAVLRVLAGDVRQVARHGGELCRDAWRFELPRPAELVIAGVAGGPAEQTWENFSRALTTAASAVSDGGTIVICCDLHDLPTGSHAVHETDEEAADDDAVLSLLTDVSNRAHVFLLSSLCEDDVEELGMGYVAEPVEIARLSRMHQSCVLLSHAQYAAIAQVEQHVV